jgi:PIN domain nuclease of toxin-antitoxin system
MEYLLDTHAFLWFINGDEQISPKAKKPLRILMPLNTLALSPFGK